MSIDFQRALDQKTRQLQLVMKLDEVRDSLRDEDDPQFMFDDLVLLLKKWFEADACAIMLVEETSDEVELVASEGVPETIAVDLCRKAMEKPGIKAMTDAPWPNMLGVQIILDDFPMGGLIIAREKQAFTDDDKSLVELVESQLDSAVVQARMTWKLTQRNRELEAIYEIDRLRDRISSEADLISGFTAVVLQHFKADFCLVLLTQADSGELVIRGIIDKYDLSPEVLNDIRTKAREINIPQAISTPVGIENLMLLAAPFLVASARLGAIVVGRQTTFTVGDHRLLHALMSQMDSAVVYSRTMQQLAQRKKELEIIYKIDRIRDREKDFDALLQSVLTELCQAVSSEMGYIMLYNQGGEHELELRAFTENGIVTSSDYTTVIQRVSREALDKAQMVFANQPEGVVRSIVSVPLILNERIIGVFGMVNSHNARGFDAEDRRILSAITSQVDTAIFERLEHRRMRTLLSRSVDPKVVEHLLQKANMNVLDGERVILTVIFADLRGSTEWAERTEPEELVNSLNAYLGQMTDVILEYGGTLDKFVGDEVIGLFGTPVLMENHAYQASAAAMAMQRIHAELQSKLRDQGRELPAMGIGVSSGEAIAGEIGHRIRSEFTALGRIVNLGSRICGAAKGGQVLISQTTFDMIHNLATTNQLSPLDLKGISQRVPVYELVAVKK